MLELDGSQDGAGLLRGEAKKAGASLGDQAGDLDLGGQGAAQQEQAREIEAESSVQHENESSAIEEAVQITYLSGQVPDRKPGYPRILTKP
ncbi:MAG: hypothetical protein ACYTG5_09750 [Planctomycetota bacterium]|jgi:hypothetical protein